MSFRRVVALALLLAGRWNPTNAADRPAGEDSIGIIDIAGVQKLVDEYRGEVLVVNVWATWCLPCVEELPDLVQLSKEPHVRVVGISIDDPEDIASKVIPFLTKHPVPFPIYVKAAGKDEMFINSLNSAWTGAVPVTFVYDRDGKQGAMLLGKQTLVALQKAVAAHRSP
jgi:thiol-disulfide isomerase/thioredoxin